MVSSDLQSGCQRDRKSETGDCLIRVPEAVAFSLRGVLRNPELWGQPMKNLLRKLLGDRGERAAVTYLKKHGYRILAKQYRNQFGEIDIIAQIGATTVFVEVKTRKSENDGQPFEAVDRRKQEKLTRAALAWLKKHRRLEQPARFDIVSILWPDDGSEPRLTHYENAFEPTGRGQMFS